MVEVGTITNSRPFSASTRALATGDNLGELDFSLVTSCPPATAGMHGIQEVHHVLCVAWSTSSYQYRIILALVPCPFAATQKVLLVKSCTCK